MKALLSQLLALTGFHFPAHLLALALVGVLVRPAAAQMSDPVDVFVSGNIRISGSPLLTVGQGRAEPHSEAMDYALFARELLAFIAKEVLPDTADEFRHSSEIPSRLSDRMPPTPSRFGAHCQIVLDRMGSAMSPFSPASLAPGEGAGIGSAFATAARVGGALLALEQALTGIRNEVIGRPSRMELDPKVGSTFGAYVTVRW